MDDLLAGNSATTSESVDAAANSATASESVDAAANSATASESVDASHVNDLIDWGG